VIFVHVEVGSAVAMDQLGKWTVSAIGAHFACKFTMSLENACCLLRVLTLSTQTLLEIV
jgi:hypothetical protein